MRIASIALALLLGTTAATYGQTATPAPAQAPAQPAPGAPVVPPPTVPSVPQIRTFAAPTGMIFNAVRPERVVDFETVIGYLQDALEKSTDPAVHEQAKGWRVLKATEPGPNGTVLYVFLIDPAIKGADYGLGKILSDAYPDRIEQIWKLYQGALAGGGSLLNLTPVQGPPPGTIPPSPAKPAEAPPAVPPPPAR
jgi:hypothetical protein